MKLFQTIIFYLILHPPKHQITIALPQHCKPDCSNRPKRECQKFEIELRASLIRCTSNFPTISETTTPVCESSQIESPKLNTNALKCTKKISITLKMTNQGETTTTNQYIIIDHIRNGKTGEKVALLNPYVIVIRQQDIMQLYGLKFLAIINGEITEKVINKRDPNYRGCDDSTKNPTCGKIIHKGKFIPYSQGFCCSCNSAKNAKRQSKMEHLKVVTDSPLNLQEFIYHNIKPDNDIVFNHAQRNKYKRFHDFYSYNGYNRYKGYKRRYRLQRMPQEMVYITPRTYRNRLEAPDYLEDFEHSSLPKKIQIRGGQDCNANDTNNESAHCLKFSDVWYYVYEISNPILEHTIYVKIFEKRETDNGCTDWFDLTAGPTIQVGSLNTKYINKLRSLQVKYYNGGPSFLPISFALDPKTKRILMPCPTKNNEDNSNEDPAEYLVVNEKDINLSGDQCDTAGVGYKAFFNQPRRCAVPQGSCLKNQPNQLWRRDKRACKRFNRGQYFLKNFARVPEEDAIRVTGDNNTKYLALYLDEKIKTALDIDIEVDDNIAFQNQARAQITEVYVDGTSEALTILTIKIFNNGLFASTFHPKLSDCPLELPVDWSNLEGDPVVIPPQHHAIFTMRLFGSISVAKFYCTVEALNDRSEVIAVRRIRIVKNDRCICSWHCCCACFKTTGLGCKLISLEHYKAAGFIGSMPLTTTMIQKNNLDHALFSFCYIVILLSFILLMVGLGKALIGFLYVPVGIWGLDILIGLRPLWYYYEKGLKCRHVVYDSEGWPIHPDTYQRTVRITTRSVEFFLNSIFFFTYPIMLLLVVSIKLCCPYYPIQMNSEKKSEICCADNSEAFVYSEMNDSKIDTDSEDLDQFEFEDLSNSTDDRNDEVLAKRIKPCIRQ